MANGLRVVGRARELEAARARLADERAGSVLFTGPAGIGKTTLLDACAADAADLGFSVRRSRAAASESEMPFLGLVDLIGGDVAEFAADLPGPLRRALDVVLLRTEPPDRGADALAANLAVFDVLHAMAGRQRLLLVLDDVQWLDAPTRGALAFAIRRLAGPRLAVIAAVRLAEDPVPSALLPEPCEIVTVGPLTEAETAQVVAVRTGSMPTPGRAAALHGLSAGNPFLAIELARSAETAPVGVVDLPVPQRYGPVLAARLAGLSAMARRALLAAALSSRPTGELLAKITGTSGVLEAEAAGVVRRTGRVLEFDHPLLAAVCRDEAEPATIRAMHADLAVVTSDPIQRARHRALSTVGPDIEVAAEAEDAADEAAARAAVATAAELAVHALALTPPESLDDGVRRAVKASEWFAQVQEPRSAQAAIEPLLAQLPTGPLRARCLVALSHSLGQEIGGTITLLQEALAQPSLQPGDELDVRLELASILIGHGQLDDARQEAARVRAEARAADDAAREAFAAYFEAMAGFFSGVSLDESSTWPVARAYPWGLPRAYECTELLLAFHESYTTDDQGRAVELFEQIAARARSRNDLSSEGAIRLHRAEAEVRRGNLAAAADFAEQGYRIISDGVRDQLPLYVRAHVAAWRGHLDEALDLASAGLRMARDAGDAIFEAQNLLVLGFAEVSAARYEAACQHESALRDLLRRMQWGHPGVFRWQGDAVETFLGLGRVDEANDVTIELWDQADRVNVPTARALAARCDALIQAHEGDLKRAQDSLAQSLRMMEGRDAPLEQARSLLALGIVRRRARQKASARDALSHAHQVFTSCGARAWARRVQNELARVGGTREPGPLTTGERSVADLAAAGATNREIGVQLFLSPKTVEAVLTRVYRKLAVRSRTELARRLQSERGE